MVTQYNNSSCKYRLDKLDDFVYLISGTPYNIHVDNGEAYISSISATPLEIKVYSLELTEDDELDERYKFTHTVKFSVNGHADYKDFGGKYYVILKSVDGVYWLVNPMFPCKVTSTYTLGANENHTDFTMATVSNHPVLKLNGFSGGTPYDCNGYQRCIFDKLRLNEKRYTEKSGNLVKYTNDGFKPVYFDKNSQTFTETFDGENVSHSVQFHIKFDDYKPSWQYNLLEFLENKYAAIIETSCGKKILTGFKFGLQPSYTINSSNDVTPDNIQITLSDAHDSGDFVELLDNIVLSGSSATSWVYTEEYGGWECVSANTAQYLLKKQVDAFGNETGQYQCLEGYESQFENLNIVGTFSTTEEFINPSCGGGVRPDRCTFVTNMPATIVFNDTSCRQYTVDVNGSWTASTSENYITVSPISGNGASAETITVCNTLTPPASAANSTIAFAYCSQTKNIGVTVAQDGGCFPRGLTYSVNANGQYVTIPTTCCISSVEDSSKRITNIQITNLQLNVYIPQNTTTTARTFTLDVTFCDTTSGSVYINQDKVYERWVKDASVCDGNKKCDLEVKYTGVTASQINTRTDVTRLTNCVTSTDCEPTYTRWIDTERTTCVNGHKFKIQKEQTSYDNVNWTDTGNERPGAETADSPAECSGETYEYRWLLTSASTCVGYDSYYLYKQQRSVSGSGVWEDVVPTVTSYNGNGTQTPQLKQSGATECGYVPPVEPMYEWRLMDISTDWICDECDATQYRWEAQGIYCEDCDLYEEQHKQYYDTSQEEWINISGETQDVVIYYNAPVCRPENKYLTFVAQEDGTFSFSESGMSYSVDDGATWTELEASGSTPTIHSGETVMWKRLYTDDAYKTFSSTGRFYVEGNAMSLVYGDDFVGKTDLSRKYNAFSNLFRGCTGITSAENMVLPATTLAIRCYYSMFNDCTSLTTAPQLPATTLKTDCYNGMFYNCKSLTTAPQLPATTLASYCYSSMFDGCTGLTTAPELPATTLKDGCYNGMFYKCTSLTTAPELPATTLATNCYSYMFRNCTSLNSITCIATDISANQCTSNWVSGVSSAGTFTKAASMNDWTTGDNGIPSNWTVQDYSN